MFILYHIYRVYFTNGCLFKIYKQQTQVYTTINRNGHIRRENILIPNTQERCCGIACSSQHLGKDGGIMEWGIMMRFCHFGLHLLGTAPWVIERNRISC